MSDSNDHLSKIQTIWGDVFAAHGEGDERQKALGLLAQRYFPAIYSYIRGAIRNDHDAADVASTFALRLMEGKLSQASPERGRFRDLIRSAVRNMITDYYRRGKGKGRMPNLPEGAPEPVAAPMPSSCDFDRGWSEETINRVWEALAAAEPGLHVVLRMKADNPELRSAEIARRLTIQTGRAATEAGVRKSLQRARERFSALLLDEVGRSVGSDDLTQIEQELIDLGLHEYCRAEIARRREG
jgi:RNA polymerase sigma-70 factor (ECF subfamily)